jgi:hypothetical protein
MSQENLTASETNENNDSYFDYITTENVEEELKKLKIIEDYDSDEYEHVSFLFLFFMLPFD